MINISIFLGLLVSIIIFISAFRKYSINFYLGFYFLSLISFLLGIKILSISSNYYILSFTLVYFSGVVMSTGPMLYFFTKFSLKRKKNPWDILHYVPIFIACINYLPFFLKSREYQEAFFKQVQLSIVHIYSIDSLFNIRFSFFFRFITCISYALWCIKVTYLSKIYFFKGKVSHLIKQWYFILTLSGQLIFLFLIFISIILHQAFYSPETLLIDKLLVVNKYWIFLYNIGLIISVLIFSSVFFNPSILYPNNYIDLGFNNNQKSLPNSSDLNLSTLKSEDFLIHSQNNFESVSKQLSLYFSNKPYLEPSFSLSSITNETNIPYHKLTNYFNVYLGVTFNNWKNDMRIEHSIELIKHGHAKNLTLESISLSCGFLSRSNFINSFKKKTGFTPSQYIKNFQVGKEEIK